MVSNYYIWHTSYDYMHSLNIIQYIGKIQLLYKEIDAYNKGVPKHLGQIADSMTEWKGRISEVLQLTPADVASIEIRHPNELRLQA